jgi:hypothetical protein
MLALLVMSTSSTQKGKRTGKVTDGFGGSRRYGTLAVDGLLQRLVEDRNELLVVGMSQLAVLLQTLL